MSTGLLSPIMFNLLKVGEELLSTAPTVPIDATPAQPVVNALSATPVLTEFPSLPIPNFPPEANAQQQVVNAGQSKVQPSTQPEPQIAQALGQAPQSVQAIQPVQVTTPYINVPEPELVQNLLAPQVDSVQKSDTIQEDPDGGLIGALRAGATAIGTDPVIQDQLAQIAQALSTRSPNSFGFQLGSSIRESAQGRQVDIQRQATLDRLAGREPAIDPSSLTISSGLKLQATQSALGEVRTAAGIEDILTNKPTTAERQLDANLTAAREAALRAGIQTSVEREQEFRLNEVQIQATAAVAQQRNVEMMQALQGTADLESIHFSTLREIGNQANLAATQVAGIAGMTTDASGNRSFRFKNPEAYEATFNRIRNNEIEDAIQSGVLPSSVRTLMSGAIGQQIIQQNQTEADTAIQKAFPNAKLINTESRDGSIFYNYDTTGDGKADQRYVKVVK